MLKLGIRNLRVHEDYSVSVGLCRLSPKSPHYPLGLGMILQEPEAFQVTAHLSMN